MAQNNVWILDCASSRHLVNDEKLFDDSRKCDDQCAVANEITICDGRKCVASRDALWKSKRNSTDRSPFYAVVDVKSRRMASLNRNDTGQTRYQLKSASPSLPVIS